MTMTIEALQAVLERHLKWLLGEDGGERADLRRADLSGADLSGANLLGAYLSGVAAEHSEYILTAVSGSGYQMVFVRHDDGLSIHCGCRRFQSLEAAREHWRPSGRHTPEHLREVLSALEHLKRLAQWRGWPGVTEKDN